MRFINNCVIYNYNGVDIHYQFFKQGECVNIFLHGWDRDLSDFQKLASKTNESYLLIDMPPFGKSGQIKDWTVFTYANMVMCLCRHLKIKKCNLIGHSFGGRISIIISAMEKDFVHKLVLIDSAGMKPRRSIRYKFKVLGYKIRKKLNLNVDNCGSQDYKKLNSEMKSVFNNIVNTHLEESAKLIDAKTLIVFGQNDQETPLYMAKRLETLIKGSRLVVMKNCSHFCFLERPTFFFEIFERFLREE